jgi:hypothetical protein
VLGLDVEDSIVSEKVGTLMQCATKPLSSWWYLARESLRVRGIEDCSGTLTVLESL